jgi:nicotinamide-nucleotide amidase
LPQIVALIVVGNEILDGIVLDSNTHWITSRLNPMGFFLLERFTVRDVVSEIARAVKRALEDGCELVIICGGLGPTHDDMTVKGVAEAFGLPMELDVAAKEIVTRQHIELYKRGIIHSSDLTEARIKMAILPRGSKTLDNRVGTAPGVLLERDEATVILLPGVPAELMWIFDNQVMPRIMIQVDGYFHEETFSLPLRDESILAPAIDEAMRAVTGVWIKSLVKPYGETGIRLWISARGESKQEVKARVERASETLKSLAERLL